MIVQGARHPLTESFWLVKVRSDHAWTACALPGVWRAVLRVEHTVIKGVGAGAGGTGLACHAALAGLRRIGIDEISYRTPDHDDHGDDNSARSVVASSLGPGHESKR
jgi:hypothetical protein